MAVDLDRDRDFLVLRLVGGFESIGLRCKTPGPETFSVCCDAPRLLDLQVLAEIISRQNTLFARHCVTRHTTANQQ
jgi:hypothetical protein